jgi:hypothetical protein
MVTIKQCLGSVPENSRNQSFSYYFCLMMEGSGAGSVLVTNDPDADPGGPKHTDPTDSDQQHCNLERKITLTRIISGSSQRPQYFAPTIRSLDKFLRTFKTYIPHQT